MKCPRHIEGYIVNLPRDCFVKYNSDEYHIQYLLKCNCGSEEFEIWLNSMPTAVAVCTNCGKTITVYDLKYYPAAKVGHDDKELVKFNSSEGDSIFEICVVYEYPELDEDEEFNPNDISWCEIYVCGSKSKKVLQVINDETS